MRRSPTDHLNCSRTPGRSPLRFPSLRTARGAVQGLLATATLISAAPTLALNDLQLAQADAQALTESPVPAAVEALLGQKDTIAVPAIPAAHQIAGWQTLGTQHLLLNVDPERTYLLTLHRDCQPLNWAQRVNVSRSDAAIWAGFDYIAADGAQCAIGEIHRVSSAGSAPDS